MEDINSLEPSAISNCDRWRASNYCETLGQGIPAFEIDPATLTVNRSAICEGHVGSAEIQWRRPHSPLRVLEIEGRTALLWPGYDLGLDTLAMDMMHADFDLVTSLLGQPSTLQVTGTGGPDGRGSAAEVILGYLHAIARCSSSSLMPQPYGMRGGWRATFRDGVLEYAMRAGFTGEGPAALTEYTADREHPIDLPATSPWAAMIDHVLACLTGHADNLIDPASALPALELTLNVHQRLTQAASYRPWKAGV